MVFGQVVIGPPGSGKTTYCNGMSQFLSLLGRYAASILTSACFLRASPEKWNGLDLVWLNDLRVLTA
jgi:broad-specificity NMP kinase